MLRRTTAVALPAVITTAQAWRRLDAIAAELRRGTAGGGGGTAAADTSAAASRGRDAHGQTPGVVAEEARAAAGLGERRAHVAGRFSDAEGAQVVANELRPARDSGARAKPSPAQCAALRTRVRKRLAALREDGFEDGVATHNSVLSVFSRSRMHGECMAWARTMRTRDTQTYNTLLHSAAKERAAGDFDALWVEFARRRPPLKASSHSYVALLMLVAKNRVGDDAGDGVAKGLPPSTLSPSLRNIGAIVRRAAKEENGVYSIYVLNAAIGACAGPADVEALYKFLKEKTDVEGDSFTLLALLGKCAGNTRAAQGYFDALTFPKGPVRASVKEWTALLNVYKEAGDVAGMQTVWAHLKERCTPSEQSYAVFVKGCVAARAGDEGWAVYNEAVSSRRARGPHLHTNMMQLCAATQQADWAKRVMRNVRGFDIRKTPPILAAYNEACGERFSEEQPGLKESDVRAAIAQHKQAERRRPAAPPPPSVPDTGGTEGQQTAAPL